MSVGTSCRNSATPLRRGQSKPMLWKKGRMSSRGPWKMILPLDSTCRGGRVGWVGEWGGGWGQIVMASDEARPNGCRPPPTQA